LRILKDLGIILLWFDSLGAKSASIYLETSMGGLVIDPGAASMQPSYPLSSGEKRNLRRKAINKIEEYCWKSKIMIITHYHYDHHVLPNDIDLRNPKAMYLKGKLLILKNPNMYINESQWNRSRLFISKLISLAGDKISNYIEEPEMKDFTDPVQELNYALKRDFGDYSSRRAELLEKGKRWFNNLTRKLWGTKPWIKEGIVLSYGTKIIWGDGKKLELGDTTINIFNPWFHGIEYDRTGWVTPILIIKNNRKIFYTSDLMGPQIEDYAYKIADIRPDAIIADGPPTYLFPYMLNRINLNRAIENMIYIIESAKPKIVIYDHHLLREKRWRERTRPVFEAAKRMGVNITTAAEYMGLQPLIDIISKGN